MPSSHGDGRGLSTVGGGKRATSQSKTVAITLVISGEVRQGYWRDESCPAVSKRSPESIEKWLKFRIFVLLPLISKTGFFFRVFFFVSFSFWMGRSSGGRRGWSDLQSGGCVVWVTCFLRWPQ